MGTGIQISVGRKNWLFTATLDDAHASAVVYSIIEMAKAHGLNIYKYLAYLFEQRPHENLTDDQLSLLVPWNQDVIDKCSK